MFTTQLMSSLTFEQTLELWNRGFEGYMISVNMTMDKLIWRFGLEGLSPELSLVAFDDEKPVGFVVNAIKRVNGRVVAWNGGTGVVPEYRRRGLGRLLMTETLRLYQMHHVDYATLEAIQGNDRAIALYQQMGYNIVDELVFYQQGTKWDASVFQSASNKMFIRHGMPWELEGVSLYQPFAAWQTQWPNVKDASCFFARDEHGTIVGYALCKIGYDPTTKQQQRYLLQCNADMTRTDATEILRALLEAVFLPNAPDCQRGTINLSRKNRAVLDILESAGFTVRAAQVYMMKTMEGKK